MRIGREGSRRPHKAEAPYFFLIWSLTDISCIEEAFLKEKNHQRIEALAVISSMADTPEAFQTQSRDFLSVGVEIYTALTPKSTNLSAPLTRQSR